MVTFTALISKSSSNGWSYILISKKYAEQLKPGARKSFRVKGTLDNHPIQKTSLLPVKGGLFMLPINAGIRKATGKKAGDKLHVSIEPDERKLTLSKDLLECLHDDPEALKFFKSLPPYNQYYFSKWVEDAKSVHTKTKRLITCLKAFSRKMNFMETMELYKIADLN